MLSADNIYEKHSSIPYNPKVADVLFKVGMIESWGRGFDKIKEECEANNTPLPEYEISERGIMVLCKWSNVNKVDSKKRRNHVIINNASF